MAGLSFLSRYVAQPALPTRLRYHYQDPAACEKLAELLSRHLQALNPGLLRPVVVLAIGTDRSTGDSLGPLVGSRLSAEPLPGLQVCGTLDEPVHATNLQEKLQEIKERYPNAVLIAIDACLGQSESVGYITLAAGALKPGAGVNKNLPAVGDIHFTGIVNVGGYMEYFVLQNTRLSVVMHMADRIARSIILGYQQAVPCRQTLNSLQGGRTTRFP